MEQHPITTRLVILGSITTLHQWLKAFRVYNTRIIILFYLLGLKLSGQPIIAIDTIIMIFSFMLSYAFASIANYALDREIDIQNKRNVPLVLKDLTFENQKVLSLSLVALALLLPLLTRQPLFNLIGIGLHLLLGYWYSHPSRPISFHPLGKALFMAFAYLLFPGLVGLGSHLTINHLTSLGFITIYYAAWQLFNDVKDIEGDRRFGKRTLAVVLGIRKLTVVSTLVSLPSLFYLLTFTSVSSRMAAAWLNIIYLILVLTQLATIVAPAFMINRQTQKIAGYLLLFSMVLLILAL
jgi:4-hydroxybenzoate polyprenyltransferase